MKTYEELLSLVKEKKIEWEISNTSDFYWNRSHEVLFCTIDKVTYVLHLAPEGHRWFGLSKTPTISELVAEYGGTRKIVEADPIKIYELRKAIKNQNVSISGLIHLMNDCM